MIWNRDGEARRAPVDWAGAGLLGAALVALFIPLTFSPLWGWGSARTIVPLVLTAVFLAAFVLVEDRVNEPMLDLDLLRKNRVFMAANSAALLNYLAVFAVTTLTAVYLEIVQGRSPSTDRASTAHAAGADGRPLSVHRPAFRQGRFACAWRPTGMVLVAAGMVQLAFASSSTARVLIALGTIGVGMAVFSAPNISAVMGSVDRSRLNLASGFLATMRFTGQGLSIAVLGAIAAWKLGPAGVAVIFLGESAGASSAPAFATGYQTAMLVGAAFALVGAVLSWVASSSRLRPSRTGRLAGDAEPRG